MIASAGCATPRTHRTGEPLVLRSDPPANPCEQRAWIQLAPTHVGLQAQETLGATQTWIMYSTHDASADGLAAYRNGLTLRLTSDQTTRIIDNTWLRPDIDAEVRAIRSKQAVANGFMIGGLVATGVGMAVAASNLEEPTAGLAIMGVGVAAELIFLLVRPHNADVAWADVRDRIFVHGETDIAALQESVDAANRRARDGCR
jgi:hypothetical protein